jgi:cytochrome c5
VREHAREGYIAMPARGGAPGLSDYDVDTAVEFMLRTAAPVPELD